MKDDTTLTSEVLEKIPNKYLAVMVASKRARVLNDGARPLLKTNAAKPTTVALDEIAQDVIVPGPARPQIKAGEEKELLPSSDNSTEEEE